MILEIDLEELSNAKIKVFDLVVKGLVLKELSQQEIASKLNCDRTTVNRSCGKMQLLQNALKERTKENNNNNNNKYNLVSLLQSNNDNTAVNPQKTFEEEAEELLDHYNETYSKSRKSTNALLAGPKGSKESLFSYWRKSYDLEDLKKAVTLSKSDPFWGKAVKAKGPAVLFRKFLPKGDPCDYIGDLLNREDDEHPLEKAAKEVYGDIKIY